MTDAQQALAQVREALAAGPTPGPWRWEVSAHGKRLQLVGGLRPQYDLTVMGFARWGMSGATIKLRDLARDGLDLLYRLHERADWIAPIPGREHHANWCSTVTHPDASFIAKCNPENIAAILAHVETQKAENEQLREMLAHLYAGSDLYCDDDELQDARAEPFIDFKRDSVADIRSAMVERGKQR